MCYLEQVCWVVCRQGCQWRGFFQVNLAELLLSCSPQVQPSMAWTIDHSHVQTPGPARHKAHSQHDSLQSLFYYFIHSVCCFYFWTSPSIKCFHISSMFHNNQFFKACVFSKTELPLFNKALIIFLASDGDKNIQCNCLRAYICGILWK